jgi:hypothetical protein
VNGPIPPSSLALGGAGCGTQGAGQDLQKSGGTYYAALSQTTGLSASETGAAPTAAAAGSAGTTAADPATRPD